MLLGQAVPEREFDSMQLKSKVFEQQIAVFGESGSGKTVLVSSFYGGALEPSFLSASPFTITSESAAQGKELQQNYLGMKRDAQVPSQTRFKDTSYVFDVRLKRNGDPDDESSGAPFNAVRLVWHDYPGEWFEQDVESDTERARRIETFRSLLGSDVALMLVDSRKLIDHAGEEERYLKSMIGNLRTGLLRLHDDLLVDGKPLARFPRIWMVALSKADLLPDVDVFEFRDLVISKVADDLSQLEATLKTFVESPDAISVGEDFVLLSSARFQPNCIEVSERIGVDLMLPLASILPMERQLKWADRLELGASVLDVFVPAVNALSIAMFGKRKVKRTKAKGVGIAAVVAIVSVGGDLAADQMRKLRSRASTKKNALGEALTGQKEALDAAEKARILYRRP